MADKQNTLIIFQGKEICRTWHNDEWSYSLVDIVSVLTVSPNPTDYLKKICKRDKQLGNYLWTNCPQVTMATKTGEMRKTLAENTKDVFRLIQSISSKNTEPFKRWLSQVGQERLNEIENSKLAQQRMKEIYEKKGHPQDWINKKLRSIDIQQNLTDEWKERRIEKQKKFSILNC